MKIAIVQDELIRRGGGEQVALCFHYAFPNAPIFTMVYRPQLTYPEFRQARIFTSFFQPIARNEKIMKRLFFPIGLLAMKKLDVTEYDVVLMSSTYCAKYVKTSPQAVVINYCHSPFRLAWYPDSYSEFAGAGLKGYLLKAVIAILRRIDFAAAQRTDFFVANAKEMAEKIKDVYRPQREVVVINPPVNCRSFHVSTPLDYFLVVCRLEHYKRVDIVVEAFNQLGLPLVVVGKGSQEAKLKEMAKPNVRFLSGIGKEELADLYSHCRALIFPQLEDYGITPLEANASGRPVIAFGKGGVLETMIPFATDAQKATALFFDTQSAEAIKRAVIQFDYLSFDPVFIRSHAERFDTPRFIDTIREFVQSRAN